MLEFKGEEYSYMSLKDYLISQNKRYSGDVTDLETGEVFNVKELYPKDFKVKYNAEDFKVEGQIVGVDISTDVLKDIDNQESESDWSRIKHLVNNDPHKLTVRELEKYMKYKGIKPNQMMGFTSYHQMNDDLEAKLFKDNINTTSYVYFRELLSMYCSLSYTLQFKNNKKIVTNKQVSDALNIVESTWKKHKTELKKFKLIREVKFEGEKYIKVNPCYVSKRKMMTPNTYYAFREELINNKMISKLQALYWDKVLIEEYDINILNRSS